MCLPLVVVMAFDGSEGYDCESGDGCFDFWRELTYQYNANGYARKTNKVKCVYDYYLRLDEVSYD